MGRDGNCLYRAIADLKEGDETQHRKYRLDTYNYIKARKQRFIKFLDEDENFEHINALMAKDANWGGQMEILALAE